MTNLEIGQRVQVSNGQPRPPKHHRRKLAAWEARNFTGTVEGLEPESGLYPGGAVRIDTGHKIAGCCQFIKVVPASQVTAITDAPQS